MAGILLDSWLLQDVHVAAWEWLRPRNPRTFREAATVGTQSSPLDAARLFRLLATSCTTSVRVLGRIWSVTQATDGGTRGRELDCSSSRERARLRTDGLTTWEENCGINRGEQGPTSGWNLYSLREGE